MPFVVPAIAAAVSAIGAFGATTVIGSITVGQIALTGLSLGASFLTQTVQARAAKSAARRKAAMGLLGAAGVKATVRLAVAPRRIAYGRVMLGGYVVFVESKDIPDTSLYQVHALCDGPIDGFERLFYGDNEVRLDGGGNVFEPPFLRWYSIADAAYYPALAVDWRVGAVPSTAFGYLTSAFPSEWTSNHRLDGIAALCVKMVSVPAVDYNRIYMYGANAPWRAVLRGRKVWDPRLGSNPAIKSFSRNPVLIALDYLMHPDGYGLAQSDINTTEFNAAASVCDESVTMLGSVTRPRYTFDGVISFDVEPSKNLTRILSTCDMDVYLGSDGKVGIWGGRWQAPTETLTASDIVSITIVHGADVFSTANRLVPKYTSPESRYEPVQAADVDDEDAQDDAGKIIPEAFDLPDVTSHDQARRLAKIALKKKLSPYRVSLTCRLTALRIWDKPTVDLDFELATGTYQIVKRTLSPDLTSVSLDLVYLPEDTYDWTPALEEVAPPPLPPDTSDTTLLPTIRSLEVTTVGLGSGQGRWTATWSNWGLENYSVDILYRVNGGAYTTVQLGVAATIYSLDVPVSGLTGMLYEVLVRVRTRPNYYTGPAGVGDSVRVFAGAYPPLAVTETSTEDLGGGSFNVTWRNPNVLTSPGFHRTVVLLNGSPLVTSSLAGVLVTQGFSAATPFTLTFRTENSLGEYIAANVVTINVT